MESTVRKYTVESTVHGTWQQYEKYNISLLMPKYTDLRDDTTRPHVHYSIFNILFRKIWHIFCALSYYKQY